MLKLDEPYRNLGFEIKNIFMLKLDEPFRNLGFEIKNIF